MQKGVYPSHVPGLADAVCQETIDVLVKEESQIVDRVDV
jgi:hypothetical protein